MYKRQRMKLKFQVEVAQERKKDLITSHAGHEMEILNYGKISSITPIIIHFSLSLTHSSSFRWRF
jgi:hypothetical protein